MHEEIPNHVAIIMDGNRRWAKERNKPSLMGHKAGAKTLRNLGIHILKSGVKVLSVFAFSTENFNRSEEEVNYLMDFIVKEFNGNYKIFEENDIKVLVSGRSERLRPDVIEAIDGITRRTADNKSGIFNICLNYGGQAEIVDATKRIVEEKLAVEDINEEVFATYMYNDLPPVDLCIRTGGEYRISNFLLWQLSYAELYFTDVKFPDFDSFEYNKAILEYNERNRSFGGD